MILWLCSPLRFSIDLGTTGLIEVFARIFAAGGGRSRKALGKVTATTCRARITHCPLVQRELPRQQPTGIDRHSARTWRCRASRWPGREDTRHDTTLQRKAQYEETACGQILLIPGESLDPFEYSCYRSKRAQLERSWLILLRICVELCDARLTHEVCSATISVPEVSFGSS